MKQRRRWLIVGISAVALVTAACTPTKKGPPQSLTFACDGVLASQTWTVPADVHFIIATLFGAEGGSFEGDTTGGPLIPGGRGGGASAALPVTPGETLLVNVGCEGGSTAESDSAPDPVPGFGGGPGGAGGTPWSGGGGGGTDLRRGGTVLLAAGGGGGAGGGILSGDSAGGPGGGSSGEPGEDGAGGVTGGGGGTQTGGGAAGSGFGPSPATAGGPGQGGNGGDSQQRTPAGGGGGGGYFGGGGGGTNASVAPSAAGGGGGSGFGPPGATLETGVWGFGDGVVLITYRTS